MEAIRAKQKEGALVAFVSDNAGAAAGFDADLVQQRVHFEATYYDKTSKDALVAVPIAAALQILTRELVIEPAVQANIARTTVDGGILVGEQAEPIKVEAAPAAVIETTPPA